MKPSSAPVVVIRTYAVGMSTNYRRWRLMWSLSMASEAPLLVLLRPGTPDRKVSELLDAGTCRWRFHDPCQWPLLLESWS